MFGALLLGYAISTFLSSIFFAQAVWYYRAYPSDRLPFKIAVGVLCASEIIAIVLCSDMIWDYLVVRGSIDPSFYLFVNSGLAWMLLPTGCCGLIVDLFYMLRIWTLTNKNKYVFLGTIPMLVYTVHTIGMYLQVNWTLFQCRAQVFS